MKVTITFETDNAAFDDNPTGASIAILQRMEKKMDLYGVDGFQWSQPIYDSNGNAIGIMEVKNS